MRLLICTQIIDRLDSTLGFFHRWVEEFSKQVQAIQVICLKEGQHDLPPNVFVHSLGKERYHGENFRRLRYAVRLWRLVWRLRREYEAVFVHMNQEYILLCALFWRLTGKHIYLWRNHYAGSWLTDLAAFFCAKVFCTSRYSYTAKYSKTIIMPVGFDTEVLKDLPNLPRVPRSILIIGRLSPSKNIHLVVEGLIKLHQSGVSFTADFYGNTVSGDIAYRERLINRVRELSLGKIINFYSGVPNTETRLLYATHEIVVNASPSGMLDKTIFSAMGRGCLVLVSNRDLVGQIPGQFIFQENDSKDLACILHKILDLSNKEKTNFSKLFQKFVLENHSLTNLANKLINNMNLRL